jgi:hypothetical protein
MSRKLRDSIFGWVILLCIAGVIGAWQVNTAFGIAALVGLLLVAGLLGSPSRCKICSNVLKRGAYVWKIENKRVRVCPKCNNSLERKVSKAGMDRFFG